jgi:hypothetical protein
MRTLCYVLTMLVLTGCGWLGQGSGKGSVSMSAVDQYKAAQKSFHKKLDDSYGLTLAQLQAQWGRVRQGLTHNKSTIYHWVQNISVTPPPEAAAKMGLKAAAGPDGQAEQPMGLSCMAVFILQDGVVDSIDSEGNCLDHSLMPGWRPVIESSGNTTVRTNI